MSPVRPFDVSAGLPERLRRGLGASGPAAADSLPLDGALVEEAIRQGVGPLLYERLRGQIRPEVEDTPEWRRLRDVFLHNGLRNESILEQLAAISGRAAACGAWIAPLKGADLIARVYPSPACRPMSDLDLLVPAERAGDLRSRLQEAGWTDVSGRDYGDHHHLGPLRRSGDVPLEVHVRLAPSGGPFDTDLDALWERSVADPGPGAIVRLAPDDLLLHLSAHLAFNDGFRAGLISYADIDRAVRRFEDELDWERLVRTATADGRARYARAALDLAGRLFDTPVPTGLWTTRDPATPAGLAEAVLGELFDPSPLPPEAARGLAEAPGLGGKIREAIRFFFPPRRELRRRYGEGAGALYLRRWAHLARRRGGAIVRRFSPTTRSEDRARHLRLRRIEMWVRGEDVSPASTPEAVPAQTGRAGSAGTPGAS